MEETGTLELDTEAAAPSGIPTGTEPSGRPGAPPAQRVRITFAKGRPIRFIGHLDLARLWERAVRRERLPLAYTLGYTPHPRLTFAAPLALGATGARELMDAFFTRVLDLSDLRLRLDTQLPAGCAVVDLEDVPLGAPSLQASMRWAEYRVGAVPAPPTTDPDAVSDLEAQRLGSRWTRRVPDESSIAGPSGQNPIPRPPSAVVPWRPPHERLIEGPAIDGGPPLPGADELGALVASLLGAASVPIARRRSGDLTQRDLRPLIIDVWPLPGDPDSAPASDQKQRPPPVPPMTWLGMLLRADPSGAGRPDEVTAALGLHARLIHRTRIGLEGQPPARTDQ